MAMGKFVGHFSRGSFRVLSSSAYPVPSPGFLTCGDFFVSSISPIDNWIHGCGLINFSR